MSKNKKSSLDELNKQMNKKKNYLSAPPSPAIAKEVMPADGAEDRNRTYSKWNTHDGNIFTPASVSTDALPPGLYEIKSNQDIGLYFSRGNISTEGILNLPDSRTDEVVGDIVKFWNSEAKFKKYGLCHKRGALLWSGAGFGKTCTIKLIISDVVARGGIAIKFIEPKLFSAGIKILREIQPEVPIVVIMEDIDATIEANDESEVINILDGVDRINKVVFLATTNFPEKLGQRVINRPSRFDRRYKFLPPSAAARKVYFEHLVQKEDLEKYDIDRWVEDTEGMSLAHLKELFTSVVILENSYENSINTLNRMKETITSSDDENGEVGFGLE